MLAANSDAATAHLQVGGRSCTSGPSWSQPQLPRPEGHRCQQCTVMPSMAALGSAVEELLTCTRARAANNAVENTKKNWSASIADTWDAVCCKTSMRALPRCKQQISSRAV